MFYPECYKQNQDKPSVRQHVFRVISLLINWSEMHLKYLYLNIVNKVLTTTSSLLTY